MSHSGGMVGNIFALLVGGYLCSWTSFDGGWPSIYYLFGNKDKINTTHLTSNKVFFIKVHAA